MTLALQTGLFFRRKLLETLRQPVWIITGLTTPALYLALFAPLLRSLDGGPGFPSGQVLDVFVPGVLVLVAFGAGMGAGWPVIWELDSGVLERLRVTPDVARPGLPALARELADAASAQASVVENGVIRLTVTDPTAAMAAVFGVLTGRRVNVLAASVGRPSLDDVFLRETGRSLRDAGTPDSGRATGADAAQEVAA